MIHAAYSQLDISQFDEADRYTFRMGTVIPRPIALVTSLSRDGVLNAAPFSQFVVISVTPPLLGFVAHEGEHSLKDTVRNVIESGEYVINTVAEPMAKQVQICSENFPPSVSEVAEVGFHTWPSGDDLARALTLKSVTAPVAISIARGAGLQEHLTLVGVMMSGMVVGPLLLSWFGSKGDRPDLGIALGCAVAMIL
jgi:flavin reductase (DIM6/NTAB) family NADH-FMN oxidoreductase RutF